MAKFYEIAMFHYQKKYTVYIYVYTHYGHVIAILGSIPLIKKHILWYEVPK